MNIFAKNSGDNNKFFRSYFRKTGQILFKATSIKAITQRRAGLAVNEVT